MSRSETGRRRGRRWLALIVALPLLVLAATWLAAPPLLELLAARFAERAGVAPLELSIRRGPLWRALVADDVRLGAETDFVARRVRVEFSAAGLLSGRLDRVDIDGAVVRATMRAGRLSNSVIESLTQARRPDTHWEVLPAVNVSNAVLQLATPLGPLALAIDASLRPQADRTVLAATVDIAHGDASLRAELDAELLAGGRVEARFAGAGGALNLEQLSLELDRLQASLVWSAAGIETLATDIEAAALRIRDLPMEQARLQLAVDGDGLSANLKAATAGGGRLVLTGRTPADGAAALAGTFELSLPDPAELTLLGLDLPLVGLGHTRVSADFEASRADALALFSRQRALPRGQGELRFDTQGSGPPGVLADISLTGTLSWVVEAPVGGADGPQRTLRAQGLLRTADGGTLLRVEMPKFSVGDPDSGLSADVELTVADASPWRELLHADAERVHARARLQTTPRHLRAWLTRESPVPRGAMTLEAETTALKVSGLAEKLSASATVNASVTASDPQSQAVAAARIGAQGTAQTLDGNVRLAFDLDAADILDAASDVTAEARLEIADAAKAVASLPAAARLGSGTVSVNYRTTVAALRAAPAAVKPWPEGEAIVQLDVDGVAAPASVALGVRGALDLELRADAVDFASREPLSLQARNVGGLALELGGLELAGKLGGDGALSVALTRSQLWDRTEPPLLGPLGVTGSLRYADAFDFELDIADGGQQPLARISGRHDPGGGGRASFETPVLSFGPGARDALKMLPVLQGWVTGVAGELSAIGSLAWRGGNITSQGTLSCASLDFQTLLAAVQGLSGDVQFVSLIPPATAPEQTLSVALFDPGLPLRQGSWTFTLREDGRVDIREAVWPWVGGRLRLAPTTLELAATRRELTLLVEEIDLAELFALLEIEGLQASGRVSGRLPGVMQGGDLEIVDGRLTALSPGGTIRYSAPANLKGEQTELLLKALDDFRYETLRLDVNGKAAGELDIRVHIRGANPELYDGYPIELNVGLQGALGELMRQGLAGYRIPESIQRRLSSPRP